MTAIGPEGEGIASRIAAVRARIATACERAGRDPASVTLIAVTKTRPAADIVTAYTAGIRDFGENYVQEGAAKFADAARLAGPDAAFGRHFIGHLQGNKVNAAVDAFDVIHSVDSDSLLDRIGHRSLPRREPVFVQVNLGGEETKGGVAPGAVPGLVDRARTSEGVELMGLMTIPPPGTPEEARCWFRALRDLAQGHGLRHLSMGMTDDFETAIEEGATHVRVGRAIFSERLR